MEETNDIAELGDMLQRLRTTDPAFRVFGSKQHRYSSARPCQKESWRRSSRRTASVCQTTIAGFSLWLEWWGGPFYGLAPLNVDAKIFPAVPVHDGDGH